MKKANGLRIFARLIVPLLPAPLLLLGSASARGDVLTVSLSPVGNVVAGSNGNGFDVLLTNTSGPAVSIGSFFFEVLASSPDITLTDATTATATSYIFGGDSLFGPDILAPGSTASDLKASDLDVVGDISLASGATVTLGRVLFDASPTALAQNVMFTLAGFPGTSLADAALNNVPITTLSGEQFTITSQAAVPEPSTLLLLLGALSLILVTPTSPAIGFARGALKRTGRSFRFASSLKAQKAARLSGGSRRTALE